MSRFQFQSCWNVTCWKVCATVQIDNINVSEFFETSPLQEKEDTNAQLSRRDEAAAVAYRFRIYERQFSSNQSQPSRLLYSLVFSMSA